MPTHPNSIITYFPNRKIYKQKTYNYEQEI
jgi:hypothetical protein